MTDGRTNGPTDGRIKHLIEFHFTTKKKEPGHIHDKTSRVLLGRSNETRNFEINYSEELLSFSSGEWTSFAKSALRPIGGALVAWDAGLFCLSLSWPGGTYSVTVLYGPGPPE